MCGIIGFMDSKAYRKALPDFWELINHRGEDSFGVIIQDNSKKLVNTAKALAIQDTKGVTKWEYDTKKKKNIQKKTPPKKGVVPLINKIPIGDFLLAHNRAASIGGKDNINLAHPITKTGTSATVSVIHNGTKKKLYEAMQDIVGSDTEAIAQLLSDCFSINETIKALAEGAGIIFGVNHITMEVFFHCDGNRPLFINENRDMIASEPIIEGKWFLIKETTTIFKDFIDFLKNVEVYENNIDVDENDIVQATLCPACNKTHFIDSIDGRCYRCIAKNIEIQKDHLHYNYYSGGYYTSISNTPPNGILVEYYNALKGDWGIGKVISCTQTKVKVQDIISNKIIEFNHNLGNSYIETDITSFLKLYEKYLFTDNGKNALKLTYTGASNNISYPFRVLNKYNSTTVYKYVMWEKDIIEKLHFELLQ